MNQRWKKYLLYASVIIVVGGFIFGLLRLILAGYSVDWTGFGEYILANPDAERGKTLWDWMELLIIPVVLAGGAILLNRSERALERKTAEDRAKLERELATDRQQEAALQTYLDRMSELLLKEKLRTTKNKEVRDIARTLTISVMRGLDRQRSDLIIQFLREAKLIVDKNSILIEANMEGMDLEGLNLHEVNMQGARLQNANLHGAILHGANLQKADLNWANLQGAILSDANLQGTDLIEANLKGAFLDGANLQGVDLMHTNATDKQLAVVATLKGATMPDGTKHE